MCITATKFPETIPIKSNQNWVDKTFPSDKDVKAINKKFRSSFDSICTISHLPFEKTSPNSNDSLAVKWLESQNKRHTINQSFQKSLEINTPVLYPLSRPDESEPFDWMKTTDPYLRIIHLSDLESGWDGYQAPAFSQEQINKALNLYSLMRDYCFRNRLKFAQVQPFIAPCSDGMILFEWAGKRFPFRQLEVYIPTIINTQFEYLKTEGECDSEGECNLSGLRSLLDWLFKFDG